MGMDVFLQKELKSKAPIKLARPFPALESDSKNQPKEEVFGRTSLRTSGQKLRSGPPNPGKKQAFWHGHAARTSTKKLRSEKLRADFSFPIEPRVGYGHETSFF